MEPSKLGLSESEAAALRDQLARDRELQEPRLRQTLERLEAWLRRMEGGATENGSDLPSNDAKSNSVHAPLVVLTEDHETVLKTLARTPHRCMQVAKLAAIGPIRNRETVGTLLKDMACVGFVDRPFGPRKGYAITKRGLDRVRVLAA